MNINIFDSVVVRYPYIIPDDAFVWGISRWGEKRWRKALQAQSISTSTGWLVRSVKHNNFKTTLILQEII
jgi:hypothetical protein